MLCGYPVTTAWYDLRMSIEQTTSRYGK